MTRRTPCSRPSVGQTMGANPSARAANAPLFTLSRLGAFGSARLATTNSALAAPSFSAGNFSFSRKLPIRDYLAAIAIFVNAVKGVSALQLGRDLDIQYKSAFVVAHKLREAIGDSQAKGDLSGEVEIDGAYFGGHVRPANEGSGARRAKENQGRQSLVIARERGGRTLPTVVAKESDAVPFIRQHVVPGAVVHADESPGWDRLHANYEMRRINHRVSYSRDGACTNQAESFFSRMRR